MRMSKRTRLPDQWSPPGKFAKPGEPGTRDPSLASPPDIRTMWIKHEHRPPLQPRKLSLSGTGRRCCYIIVEGQPDTRCAETALHGQRFCAEHKKKCDDLVGRYQNSCHDGYDDARWQAANTIRSLLFPENNPTEVIQTLQESLPTSSMSPVPIADLDTFQADVRSRFNTLTSQKKAQITKIVQKISFRSCFYGRQKYRVHCEGCDQDPGHVHAYYLMKLAEAVTTVLDNPSTLPPQPNRMDAQPASPLLQSSRARIQRFNRDVGLYRANHPSASFRQAQRAVSARWASDRRRGARGAHGRRA